MVDDNCFKCQGFVSNPCNSLWRVRASTTSFFDRFIEVLILFFVCVYALGLCHVCGGEFGVHTIGYKARPSGEHVEGVQS